MAFDLKKSYFKVYRSIFEHWLWKEKPYDQFHAWMWIVGRANFADEQRLYRGQLVTIKRGQLVTSYEAMAEAWGWSRNRVIRYTDRLQNEGMIAKNGTTFGTTLTVENYEKYQVQRYAVGTSDGTPDGTPDGTHYKNVNKNANKNEREGALRLGRFGHVTLTPEQRDEFMAKYPEDGERFIQECDEYAEEKGLDQRNLGALLRWAKKDGQLGPGKAGSYKTGAEKVWEEMDNGTF